MADEEIKPYKAKTPEEAQAIGDYLARSQAAMHAVQSAVQLEYSLDHPRWGDELNRALKHLRVGVDSAMVEHAALVATLIDAGVIEPLAYYRNLALYSEREKAGRVAEFKKRWPNVEITFA